jgi:aminodeoxyfutalosine deaminase
VTSPSPPVRAFRARWVFPVDSPPIRDGVVVIAGQHIRYVGPDAGDIHAVDLGNVAILPGLVNAHTHLEFSGLDAPLGQPGMRFTDWIAAVVQHRRARDADDLAERTQAIRRGIIESLGHGVTAIGEISTGDWPVGAVSDLPMEGIVFRELLGMTPERIETEYQSARAYLELGSEKSMDARCRKRDWLRSMDVRCLKKMGLARNMDVRCLSHFLFPFSEVHNSPPPLGVPA